MSGLYQQVNFFSSSINLGLQLFARVLGTSTAISWTSTLIPQLQKTDAYVKEMIAKTKLNPRRDRANRLLIFQYFMNQWVDGKIVVDGLVAWKDFRQNVKDGLTTILQHTGAGETNAAFTSGGTISAIAAESLKIMDEKVVASLNFTIRNTSYSSFFYSKGNFNLSSLNELPHLSEDMVTFV